MDEDVYIPFNDNFMPVKAEMILMAENSRWKETSLPAITTSTIPEEMMSAYPYASSLLHVDPALSKF